MSDNVRPSRIRDRRKRFQKRQSRMKQRFEQSASNSGGFVAKSKAVTIWTRPGNQTYRLLNSKNAFIVSLNPDVDPDTEAYKRVLKRIQKLGMKVLQGSTNRFMDTMIIQAKSFERAVRLSEMDEVDSVTTRPRIVKRSTFAKIHNTEAFFPSLGAECTAEDTKNQAAKIDTIRGPASSVTNTGRGSTIVVWDFAPESSSDLNVREFDDRPGGSITLYESRGSSAIDPHGAMVSSACCGVEAGLSTGSNLALIGLSDTITNDLAIIDDICESTGKPVIVNMSFGLNWYDIPQSGINDVIAAIEDFNAILEDMRDRHPQLIFVAAAGNESVNMCESRVPISYETCEGCMTWPQFTLGGPYGTDDVPFVQVGATKARSTEPRRPIAPYSNFGGCVHIFGHGGNFCVWDTSRDSYTAVQGTSFSAPLFSSMCALAFSKSNNKMDAKQVIDLLLESAKSEVAHNGSTGSVSNDLFAVLPESLRKLGPEEPNNSKLPSEDGEVNNTGDGEFESIFGDDSNERWFNLVLIFSLGIVLLVILYLTRPKLAKLSKKTKKVYSKKLKV